MSRIVRKERAPKVLRPDPQREAPKTSHLDLVRRATSRLPFSFTIFFTDEHNQTVKFGQFAKVQDDIF